jgi:hypothetical protein
MTLHGTVTDENNHPLPGANVYYSDASGNILQGLGRSTNAAGEYSGLTVPAGNYITASFVGYQRKTVANGGNTPVNFQLQPSGQLDPFTVTAVPKRGMPWWILAVLLTLLLLVALWITHKK